MAAATPLLESITACGIGYTRGHTRVLRDVSFSLQRGSGLLLRGPNGSGKTTLLRLAAGFMRPTEGAFLLNGLPVEPKRHNDLISGHVQLVAARNDGLKPVLTVHENLRYWTAMFGGTDAALERAYAKLGLWHLRDREVRSLSSGQRRILSIARVLAAPCSLWLLDEPTIALDAANVGLTEWAIREHRANGGMVIVASHADIALDDAVSLEL